MLGDVICRLLGDAILCDRLGAAARRTVVGRFSWQTIGTGYLRCYSVLLEEVSSDRPCLRSSVMRDGMRDEEDYEGEC
jgi:hypothetical protein